jgi:hypothetical protein
MTRFALLFVAACGGAGATGDAAELACGASGTGSVFGMIADVSVTPVMRAFVAKPSADTNNMYVVVLDELGGATCVPATSSHGDRFMMVLCDQAPVVGTYMQGSACPLAAAGFVERANGQAVATSATATVTISRVDASCVAGTFATRFDLPGGSTSPSGSFAAVTCP